MSQDGTISRLDPDFIRISEAAAELGRSRSAIWKMVASGRLQGFRSGRCIFVKRSELGGLFALVPYEPPKARPSAGPAAPELVSA